MDYTKPEIRPLIYQNIEEIDLFDINDATALDAEMFHRIEYSEIVTFDGADKYILDIFNNAYYITTLIMMEKHPVLFYRKYINIAEHTGSAYKDIYHKNTLYQYFSAMVMAMVCNYLRLLDDNYCHKNNLILLIMDFFEKEPDQQTLNGPYSLFSENTIDVDELSRYHVKKECFKPRFIDTQAIIETDSRLNGMNSGWRGLTRNYNHKDIVDLLSICQNNEGKAVMVDFIRREAEGYHCDETAEFLDSLDLKLTTDVKAAAKKADVALLRHHCILLMDQISELTTQVKPQSPQDKRDVDNKRIAELEAKVEELQQKLEESGGEQVWIDWLDRDVFHPSINAEEVYKTLNNYSTPQLGEKARCYVLFRVLDEIKWLKKNVVQKDVLKWWSAHFGCNWNNDNQLKFTDIPDKIKKSALIEKWKNCGGNNNELYYNFAQELIKAFVWNKGRNEYISKKQFVKEGCFAPEQCK